jgi:secreted trypsin-like serine protease
VGRRLFVLGLLLLAFPAGASARAGKDIVGGDQATRDYPWQAYLEVTFPGSGTYTCGGSLIAARYVVTAGHCVTGPKGNGPSEVNLALGVSRVDGFGYLTDPNNVVPADHRYLHISGSDIMRNPSYTEIAPLQTPDYDAAVIRLPRPAPEEQLRLARATDTALWAPGRDALATGWGVTETGFPSDDLMEVSLPIAPDTTCDSIFERDYRPATMLCAGDTSGRDTCQGDSGGPLMTSDHDRFVLVGLTSFGNACGESAAVYTRVGNPDINGWIRSIVPQVELTQDVAAPEPGQEVTFTATPTHPAGAYDHIAWDTDGDGEFDDAADVLSVKTVVGGPVTVSVRATRAATEDAEVRSLSVVPAVPPSPVSFAGGDVTVTEGQAVQLTVAKAGSGTGTVLVTPRSGTATVDGSDVPAAPQTLTFAAGQSAQNVTIATVDDASVESPETFRVDLGGHTGDLEPATPGSVIVTIVDNDVPPPPATARLLGAATAKVAKRAFRVRLSTSAGGFVRATAKDRAGHVLAQALTRKLRRGTASIRLKLTPRGRQALKRHPRLKVTLSVVYQPPGIAPRIVLKRTITLKR